jgi:hypothetical protein
MEIPDEEKLFFEMASAISKEDFKLAEFHLQKKTSDVNIRRGALLSLAVSEGNTNGVQFLLNNGAQMQQSLLTCAARKNFFGIVMMLLSFGADPNEQFAEPFLIMARTGQLDIFRAMYAKIDKSFLFVSRALVDAIKFGKYHIVKFLLKTNFVFQSETYISAIMRAERYYHYDICMLLYEKNVDETALDKFSERAQRYIHFCIHAKERAKVTAAKTISKWWIPICYDLSRESGVRMMEAGWARIEAAQKEFASLKL